MRNSTLRSIFQDFVLPTTSATAMAVSAGAVVAVGVTLNDAYNHYRVLDLSASSAMLLVVTIGIASALLFVAIQRFGKCVTLYNASTTDKKPKLLIALGVNSLLLAIAAFTLSPMVPVEVCLSVPLATLAFVLAFEYADASNFTARLSTLLFFAMVISSVGFATREEQGAQMHQEYLATLVEPFDSTALRQLNLLTERCGRIGSSNVGVVCLEREFLDNQYLAANYGLTISDSTDSNNLAHNVIGAYVDETAQPAVAFTTANGINLVLRYALGQRRSHYLPPAPYRQLSKLGRYEYAALSPNGVAHANAQFLLEALVEHNAKKSISGEVLALDEVQKVKLSGYDGHLLKSSAGGIAIVGEPLSELEVWASNTAFILLVVIALIGIILSLHWLISKQYQSFSWQFQPLESRIQVIVLSCTVMATTLAAVCTFAFITERNHAAEYSRYVEIGQDIQHRLARLQFDNKVDQTEAAHLREWFGATTCDIDLYNSDGELIVSSLAGLQNARSPRQLDEKTRLLFHENFRQIELRESRAQNSKGKQVVVAAKHADASPVFAVINVAEARNDIQVDAYTIMGRLLVVYVLTLLIVCALARWSGHYVTKPIKELASHLRSFELGAQREALYWPGPDALGMLTTAYNDMSEEVQASSLKLVAAGKEGAWRVMAQQIAHEINNKLTPLRLSAQFVERCMAQGEKDQDRLQSFVSKMIHRVDDLSEVADKFSLFAKLETPTLVATDLLPIVEAFTRQIKLKVNSPIKFLYDATKSDADYESKIDGNQFEVVLENLITNADTALEECDESEIKILMAQDESHLKIEVIDNGPGISDQVLDTIFEPKFEVQNHSTGLGLPTSARIIQSFGGTLTARNRSTGGACFTIVLPLAKAMVA